MVIKPVSPREPVKLEVSPIAMATECWQWCQGTWQKGHQFYEKAKDSWVATKQWVHDSIEWVWLLFLAIVASESDLATRGRALPKANHQCEVRVDKEDSFTDEFVEIPLKNLDDAPEVESDQISEEQQSYDEETQVPEVLVEEPVIVVRNEAKEVARFTKPSQITPYTIVEEDEDEDDIEEKEKQWRVANGGLTRFAGLQNLAMRSQSLADEDAFDEDSSAAGLSELRGSSNVKCEVLWQSLVAKYASDDTATSQSENKNEVVKHKEPSFEEDSANFRQLIEQHDSVGKITKLEEVTSQEIDSSQMSEKEFSAALGKRLKEYLAKEETNSTVGEVGEMSGGDDFEGTDEFTVDEVKDISDEVVSTSLHSDLPSDSCKIHFDVIDETPELTMPKISDDEDLEISELRRDIEKMLGRKKPYMQSLRIETVDESEELVLDEDSKPKQGESMYGQLKPKITIELPDEDEKQPEDNNSRSQVSAKFDDVSGIVLEDVLSMESTPIQTPLKITKNKSILGEIRECQYIKEKDKHVAELIHEQSEDCVATDMPKEYEYDEEEEQEEIAVVADFCFKLRPKAKDTISFGIKEEASNESSLAASSFIGSSEPKSNSKSQSSSAKKSLEKPDTKLEMTESVQSNAAKEERYLMETDFPFIEEDEMESMANRKAQQSDVTKQDFSAVINDVKDTNESLSVDILCDSAGIGNTKSSHKSDQSSGEYTKSSHKSDQSSGESIDKVSVSRSIVFNAAPFLGDDLGEAPKIMTYDIKECEPDIEFGDGDRLDDSGVVEDAKNKMDADGGDSVPLMQDAKNKMDADGGDSVPLMQDAKNKMDADGGDSVQLMQDSCDTVKIIPSDQLTGVFGENLESKNFTKLDFEEEMLENEEGTSVDGITKDFDTETENNMIRDKFNLDQYEIASSEDYQVPIIMTSKEEYEHITSYQVQSLDNNSVERFNTDVAEIIDISESEIYTADVVELDIREPLQDNQVSIIMDSKEEYEKITLYEVESLENKCFERFNTNVAEIIDNSESKKHTADVVELDLRDPVQQNQVLIIMDPNEEYEQISSYEVESLEHKRVERFNVGVAQIIDNSESKKCTADLIELDIREPGDGNYDVAEIIAGEGREQITSEGSEGSGERIIPAQPLLCDERNNSDENEKPVMSEVPEMIDDEVHVLPTTLVENKIRGRISSGIHEVENEIFTPQVEEFENKAPGECFTDLLVSVVKEKLQQGTSGVIKNVEKGNVKITLISDQVSDEQFEESPEQEPLQHVKEERTSRSHQQETITYEETKLDIGIDREIIDLTCEGAKEENITEEEVVQPPQCVHEEGICFKIESEIDDITVDEHNKNNQPKQVDEIESNKDNPDDAADFWSLLGSNDDLPIRPTVAHPWNDLPVRPTVAHPWKISSTASGVAPIETEGIIFDDQIILDLDEEHLPSEVTEGSATTSKTIDDRSGITDEQIQEPMDLAEAGESLAEEGEDFQRNIDLAIDEYVDDAEPHAEKEFNTTKNLFSDIVVDETYNMILDKEASMEADESSGSIKKGILDTTVYDLDSNFDSKDIFDNYDIDMADSRLKPDMEEYDVGDNASIDEMLAAHIARNDRDVPEHLSDIQDLLTSRSDRNKFTEANRRDEYSFSDDEMPIGDDQTDLEKYRSLSPGLTAEEEAELAELAAIDKKKAEEEFKKFMELPSGLTQQELDELAAFQEEKESSQAIRDAERRELEKFLGMPAGLTEQEQAELTDLLAEDARETEISQASEDRLAAFLAAARAESGCTDAIDDEPFDDYLNLPVGLTEEEERMLREGTDGEVDLLKDEEDREKIRRRYLEELDEDEDRVLLDEYEFAEQYGSDFEYDDDYDYDEDMEGDYYFEDKKGVAASCLAGDPLKPGAADVVQKGVIREAKVAAPETRGDEEPVAPPRKAKKVSVEDDARKEGGDPSTKTTSFVDERVGKINKSKVSKLGEENKRAEDVQNKKFFRLGALGTKRKRKTCSMIDDQNGIQANYKTVRKKKARAIFERDSGYNSFANDSTAGNSPIVKNELFLTNSFKTNSLHGSSLSLKSLETESFFDLRTNRVLRNRSSSQEKSSFENCSVDREIENVLLSANVMVNQNDSFKTTEQNGTASRGHQDNVSTKQNGTASRGHQDNVSDTVQFPEQEGQQESVLIKAEKNVFIFDLNNQDIYFSSGDKCQPLISKDENSIETPLLGYKGHPITSTMNSNTMDKDHSAIGDCSLNREILARYQDMFCLHELIGVEESCVYFKQSEMNTDELNESQPKPSPVESIPGNLAAVVVSGTISLSDELNGNGNAVRTEYSDEPNPLIGVNACSKSVPRIAKKLNSENASYVSDSPECIIDGFAMEINGAYKVPVATNNVVVCSSVCGVGAADSLADVKRDYHEIQDMKSKDIVAILGTPDTKTNELNEVTVQGFTTKGCTQKNKKKLSKRKPRLSVSALVQKFSSKVQEQEKNISSGLHVSHQKNNNNQTIQSATIASSSAASKNETGPNKTVCDAVECNYKCGGIHNDKHANSSNFGHNSTTRLTEMISEADDSDGDSVNCSVGVGSSVVVNTPVASWGANCEAVEVPNIVNVNEKFRPMSSCLRQPCETVTNEGGAVQYSAMATMDEEASGDCGSDAEEVVEERKEYIENPDGTYTVRTIKTIVTMVEEEEEEEEGENNEEEGRVGKEEGDDEKYGADGLGQLTQEELTEYMMLQAERKWLDKLATGEEEVEEKQAVVEEEETTTKKKKKRPDGEKKGKKKKKRGDGKENKRDALAQRDILAKHVGPRIRSFDSAKMKSRFEKPKEPTQVSSDCRACGKQVFQMEKIVAEKASWHKNCFRCSECSKNLTLETYQSHEGVLYCKPHFKELFRPKAVVEDPAEARKERLLRRPKMIVLESNPEVLPDDVVRATSKPDYGLEELASLNMKQRFSMFESAGLEEEEHKLEPVSVRRSQSMISRAARFLAENGDKEYGVDSSELGEYEDEEENKEDEDEEEEEEVEEEDGVDEDGEPIIVKTTRKIKKKSRPTSFNSAGDLKEMKEKQSRRDEMTRMRKEELGRFRQMLCAGKNISLKEKFESGHFENEDKDKNLCKEEIKIDQKRAARSLKEKFEKGQPFILDDDGESDLTQKHVGERQEVEEVFKEAETASHARNLFRQIDSKVNQDGSAALMRSQSFATVGSKENRRSMDVGSTPYTPPPLSGDIVRCHDLTDQDPHVDAQDLATKFMFFATFEDRQKQDAEKKRKVFRMTPPREGADQGLVTEDVELGRDPNLIKCTDNYQDEVDCRNTKSILNMFRKMEAKNVMGVEDEEDEAEGEGEYEEDEYSDEEGYSDDEEYSGEEEEEEDEEGDEKVKAPYKDELLQMSAKKAAQLRAKFEKWEAEVDRNNDINKANGGRGDEDEEAMPSLDTARNLKAMFEEKAQEAAKPQIRERAKVNRFV